MKIIKDIRLYKSEVQNEYGVPIINSFSNNKLTAIVHRIVMKLREFNFSFGDFDHLYINFTTADIDDEIKLLDRVDNEHPWYRYCSVKVSDKFYFELEKQDSNTEILYLIQKILVSCFSSDIFNEDQIIFCIQKAIEQGENMTMLFKEKSTSKRKAKIFLRYLDSGKYYPLLKVYDIDENLLFEKDLPETITLDYFGNIQLSANKIIINPRKNVFTTDMKPIIFEY